MEGEIDIATVSDAIGNDLFGSGEPTELPETPDESPQETGTAEPAAPVVKEGEPEAVSTETTKEEVAAPVGAPKTWRKEALAAWETLPEVVKAEVAKREEDMFKGIEGYKQSATVGENFHKVIAPHLDYLQRAGVNPYQELEGMLEYGKIMRLGSQAERMQLLSAIAQQYNIDPLDLAEHQTSQPYVDPAVKALQAEINNLKSVRQQETSQSEIQLRNENQARIDSFKADPKHTDFDLLESEMAAFISTGVCKTLDEAYEKALWANPVTRAKEQQRQTAELTAQSQAKVEAAKKAQAANLKTNARPGSATTPQGSMDDTLQATLANIRSR